MCERLIYKATTLIFLLVCANSLQSQSMSYNDGTDLTVGSSVAIYLDEMGFTNQSELALNGSVNNEGDIYVDGNWYNNANNGVVFTNLNSIGSTHYTGSSAQVIGGSGSTTFENLEINNTSVTGVTLEKEVTVNVALTLTDGKLYTDENNMLELIDDATSNEGSDASYVSGPFKKTGDDAFIFPVGKAGRWAIFGITTPDNYSCYTVEFFNTRHANTVDVSESNPVYNVDPEFYWHLDRRAGSGKAQAQLFWKNGSEHGIDDLGELKVARFNGNHWRDDTGGSGASGNISNGNIKSVVLEQFGDITFASGNKNSNPLPIELISFDARVEGSQVNLEWMTASETNNDYFTIERSRDGLFFEPLTTVQGAGNSVTILQYDIFDTSPIVGQSYYRLKQTDYDGAFEYSRVIGVNIQSGTNGGILVYPNPVQDNYIFVMADESNLRNFSLDINDLSGRSVFHRSYKDFSWDQSVYVEIDKNVVQGIYMLILSSGELSFQERLVVK